MGMSQSALNRGTVNAHQRPLLRPREGEIDPLRQLFGGEIHGLSSGKNSRDNVGRKDSQRDQVSHIAMGDAFGPGNLRERSGPTAREPLEPLSSTYDRFHQGRVDSGLALALLPAVKDESHLDATAPNTGRDRVTNDCAFFTENSR